MAPAEILGNAFGLEIEASFAVPALGSACAPGSRRTRCEARSARELDERWRDEGSASALERRFPDGRLFLGVRSHPEAGFRIWAPRHGRRLVSPDGTAIQSALPRSNALGWQRLFFAQTLPLAAALQASRCCTRAQSSSTAQPSRSRQRPVREVDARGTPRRGRCELPHGRRSRPREPQRRRRGPLRAGARQRLAGGAAHDDPPRPRPPRRPRGSGRRQDRARARGRRRSSSPRTPLPRDAQPALRSPGVPRARPRAAAGDPREQLPAVPADAGAASQPARDVRPDRLHRSDVRLDVPDTVPAHEAAALVLAHSASALSR